MGRLICFPSGRLNSTAQDGSRVMSCQSRARRPGRRVIEPRPLLIRSHGGPAEDVHLEAASKAPGRAHLALRHARGRVSATVGEGEANGEGPSLSPQPLTARLGCDRGQIQTACLEVR